MTADIIYLTMREIITMEAVCQICKASINEDEDHIFCVNCDSAFHFSHLQLWTREKSKCPLCKQPFLFKQMQELRTDNPAGDTTSRTVFQKTKEEQRFEKRIEMEWEDEKHRVETPYYILYGAFSLIFIIISFLVFSLTGGIISITIFSVIGVKLLRK